MGEAHGCGSWSVLAWKSNEIQKAPAWLHGFHSTRGIHLFSSSPKAPRQPAIVGRTPGSRGLGEDISTA